MAEQNLNDRQLGAIVEHVGSEAVPQSMRMHWLGDPGATRSLAASMPDDLVGDGIVRAFGRQAGEHPTVAPRQGAVVSAQLLAQLGTERNFAGLAAFSMRDANDHALFVDVLGTELAEFGAAHAGVIQSHQDGAVAEIGGGVDETPDLIGAQHDGDLAASRSWQWQVVAGIAAAQDFEIEEAKGRHLHHDRLRFELALFDEVQLVLPNLLGTEFLRRLMEVFGEPPDTTDIGMCGSVGVIA